MGDKQEHINVSKDYKDLIILGIVAIGISIAWFAYLIYLRDRENKERMQPLSYQVQTDVPVSTHPIYEKDEKLYQLLENQQYQLEHINSNINNLRSLNYKMPDISNINKLSQSRAGSVTSIKTTEDDKIRQKDFGMI